jgi:hypothetical protein
MIRGSRCVAYCPRGKRAFSSSAFRSMCLQKLCRPVGKQRSVQLVHHEDQDVGTAHLRSPSSTCPPARCADRSRAPGAGEGEPDCGAGLAATSQACQPQRVCIADRNTASGGIKTWMRGRGRSGDRPSRKPSRPCAPTPVSLRGRRPMPSNSHGARYDSSTAWRSGAGDVRLLAHL